MNGNKNSLRMVFSLLLAHIRHQPARLLLASLAVIAASCAVVWVVSGYDALVAQFDEHASTYLGRYDIIVVPKGPMGGSLPGTLIDDLRTDPAVAELNAITQSRVTVASAEKEASTKNTNPIAQLMGGSRPPVYGAPPLDPVLVGTDAGEPPYELLEGKWLTDANESAVMTDLSAKRLGVSVGDMILITSLTNQTVLPLVGIVREPALSPSLKGSFGKKGGGHATPKQIGAPQVHQGRPNESKAKAKSSLIQNRDNSAIAPPPKGSSSQTAGRPSLPGVYVAGPAKSAVYVPMATAERINGYRSPPSVVQLALHEGTRSSDFLERWNPRFSKSEPSAAAIDLTAVEAGMGKARNVSSKKSQAYSATGMALLAALFIIFTTLSMGVSERARELAVLRAIGLTRGQVVALIFSESFLLALIGWGGGLLAGFGLLRLVQQAQPDLFPGGVSLGIWCVLLTGGSALGGSLAAAIVPAWRAARVRPLDAMVPPRPRPHSRTTFLATVVGIGLIAINPLAVFVLQIPVQSRSWIYWIIGYPTMVVGFLLLVPAVIFLTEKCFGYLLARVLWLDAQLTSTQISANLWRTIGTTVALCVGLSLYVSTQTWGYAMLQPFLPGNWLPDALVAFQPVGLDDSELADVRSVPGVKSSECLPVAVEQPKFADFRPTPLLQHNNVILMGVAPETAFGGKLPFLDLDFIEGKPEAAVEQMGRGGCCLIPESLAKALELHLGDTLKLVTPKDENRQVAYRIAGIVSLPGWHWFTKFSGVRRHETRTAAIVFASYPDVRRDFQLKGIEYCWLNLNSTVPRQDTEEAMQALAQRHAGETYLSPGHGQVMAHRPTARLTTTKTLGTAIGHRADSVIWGMSQLPLVTLAIASLAVVNTMVSSTRMRRWEMGVLRSQGMTRSALVRLVLAEAILIGVAASLLSLAFGLTAGWCGAGMARYGGFFGGIQAPLLVPWRSISLGMSVTILLCLFAAIWPAIMTGRTEPLKLLQSGRGTM